MTQASPDALALARRIAAGESIELADLAGLDPRLARGLGRVAEIARQCEGEQADKMRWGHLRDLRHAGSGSFGDVYRAYDPTLDRDVALKLKRVDVDGLFVSGRDFVAEARRLARVRHPNVLAVHGASFHQNRAGLWSDWIDGETLRRRLERESPLPIAMVWTLARDLASALQAVHDAGLIHGDVKPANIMLDTKGHAILMDFGASLASEDESALVTGTPRYLAPEVARRERPSTAVDLYALGVVLYRAATGVYPSEQDVQVRPARLRRLVRALLADSPAERPNAAAVLAVIQDLQTAPLRRARQGLIAASMLGLLGIAGISTFAYQRADALRIEAQKALAGTERANRFLSDLLALSSPDELGPQASLRQLLDLAPKLAQERFADDAYGRGLILGTLASIESELANDEQAAILAAEAAMAALSRAPDAADTVRARSRALVLRAIAGDPTSAMREQQDLLAELGHRRDAEDLRPQLLAHLAEIEHRAWLRATDPGLRARVEQHLAEALARRSALDAHTEVLALRRLGSMRLEQGSYAEGATLMREALARSVAAFGDDHAITALTRRTLAWSLMHDGNTLSEGEALFRENLARHGERVGWQSRTAIDDRLGLAHALASQNRYEAALPLARAAWQEAQVAYGHANRTTLDAGLTLTLTLTGLKRWPEARQELTQLRELISRNWGEETRHYVLVTQQLAQTLEALGEFDAGQALHRDCAERARRLLGEKNPLTLGCTAALKH